MKAFLKFAGLIAAVLALVAFILMLASNALVTKALGNTYYVAGTSVLFGEKGAIVDVAPAATAIIAFIFVIVAILILVLNFVMPLLKVKAFEKVGKILNFVAIGALVLAGIFLFFTRAAFSGANDGAFDDYNLAFGYVFAAILLLLGGVVAFLPTAFALVGKKK